MMAKARSVIDCQFALFSPGSNNGIIIFIFVNVDSIMNEVAYFEELFIENFLSNQLLFFAIFDLLL